MGRSHIINFSVPEGFEETLSDFSRYVEKDVLFQQALKGMNVRYNKKNVNNKLWSAKLRFAIVMYVRQQKKIELEQRKKEYDEETKNRNIQENRT